MDWPAIVEHEGVRLADAAAADPAAAVPAAPGWDVTELLRHIGQIHARTSVILRNGSLERPSRRNGMLPDPPADVTVDWYRSTLAELVGDLRAVEDPEQPVWSFSPDHQHAGFWPRRMAHETTIHRVDAQQATGRTVDPIDPMLAADGIEEIFTVFVPALGAARSPGDGRTVHLHAADGAGEWSLRFDPGGVDLQRDHVDADADATVSGPAEALLLWLWGRRPLDDLDVHGNADVARALREITTF